MEKLKPCPFCGGEGKIKGTIVGELRYFISCKICDLETALFDTKIVLTRYWNKRIKP